MQSTHRVMRDYEEEDPGKPRPVHNKRRFKRTTNTEASEGDQWSHLRKDNERDRHRHVV
jgi:hypothetical protein